MTTQDNGGSMTQDKEGKKDMNMQHPTESWITKWCDCSQANTWHEWNEKQPPHDKYTCKKCGNERTQ